jgi:exonuclease III
MDWTIQSKDRLSDWIKQQDPTICCLQEIQFTTKDTLELKVKAWKKVYLAGRNGKQAWVAIPIWSKADFK